MPKVILCGASGVEAGNFGDVLMEQMVVDAISSAFPSADVERTANCGSLKSVVKWLKADWKELRSADALIYLPGGYLGFIEKWYSGTWRKTLQRAINYYLPGLKALFLRKRVLFVGVGLGPFEYRLLRPALSLILRRASLVTCRDLSSYRFALECGAREERTFLTSDIAQCIANVGVAEEREMDGVPSGEGRGRTRIFLHYGGHPQWMQKVRAALAALEFLRTHNVVFVIGTDGPCPRDALARFAAEFPAGTAEVAEYTCPSNLIEVIRSVDVVLTAKLHVGVVASSLSKGVLCFSCQFDKAVSYYREIGFPLHCYDLFVTSEQEMSSVIVSRLYKKVRVSPDHVLLARRNLDMLQATLQRSGEC